MCYNTSFFFCFEIDMLLWSEYSSEGCLDNDYKICGN